MPLFLMCFISIATCDNVPLPPLEFAQIGKDPLEIVH